MQRYCLECSTNIYPERKGYKKELCPHHYEESIKSKDEINCPECNKIMLRPGLCSPCALKGKFELTPVSDILHQVNVPPRTARMVQDHMPVQEYDPQGDLYLSGPSGHGKTFMAMTELYNHIRTFACNPEYYQDKMTCLFVSVPELLDQIRQSFKLPNDIGNDDREYPAEHALMCKYKNVDVLVLDDIGVEKPSDWVFMTLYLIINHRYEHEKTTIFTSNFSLEELAKRLGDTRLTSRIGGWCKIVEVKNKDFRVNPV